MKKWYYKKEKWIVVVEVYGLEVEETSPNRGWYKYDFTLKVNKKLIYACKDGSWSSQTKRAFERKLRNGLAHEMILQDYFG